MGVFFEDSNFNYYLVTEMVAPCSASGADTTSLLLASLTIVYFVSSAVAVLGSLGKDTKYLPLVVSTVRSVRPVHVPPVVQISLAGACLLYTSYF